MSDADSRYRQYAGLALIILAYIGGIIGWSWATLSIDSEPAAPDTTHTRIESPPDDPERAGEGNPREAL